MVGRLSRAGLTRLRSVGDRLRSGACYVWPEALAVDLDPQDAASKSAAGRDHVVSIAAQLAIVTFVKNQLYHESALVQVSFGAEFQNQVFRIQVFAGAQQDYV